LRFHSFRNRVMFAAWAGGVTTNIVEPQRGNGMVAGLSAAFHTVSPAMTNYAAALLPAGNPDTLIVQDVVSLDVYIGNTAKGAAPSVSAQIGALRNLFVSANTTSGPFQDVLTQKIPLVVHVNQVDQIVSVLRLQQQFSFRLIIFGGAEAWKVADVISATQTAVVMAPPRTNSQVTFEAWDTRDDALAILIEAGVKVGVGLYSDEPSQTRNLRWEIGWVVARNLGVTWYDGMKAITKNIGDIFGITDQTVGRIEIGQPANLVMFNGDPLSLESSVQIVAVGTFVDCSPTQF